MHSPWVSRLLAELGHEVIVAHARNVRLIGESRRKDDRLDAGTLARLARIDPQLLAPVKHRSRQAQAHLTVIRARASLAPPLIRGFRMSGKRILDNSTTGAAPVPSLWIPHNERRVVWDTRRFLQIGSEQLFDNVVHNIPEGPGCLYWRNFAGDTE